jgi:hypothetical protein
VAQGPGQDPNWPVEVTNRPFVNLKWWVPSRAFTRVKLVVSLFAATKPFAVGNSLGGAFRETAALVVQATGRLLLCA